MSKVPYLDFQAIKLSVSITEIMEMTGLPFKRDGKSFRCECPVHKGGPRSLVVTPDQGDEKNDPGVFYCFGEKVGGDRVALLAHVRDSKPYAIFKELAERKPTIPVTVPQEKEQKPRAERGFQPLDYLQAQHPSVQALGISPDVASELGIGFAPRGFHRGCVAIPVRSDDGRLSGYIGFDGSSLRSPPKWNL
jgi:DNA primase